MFTNINVNRCSHIGVGRVEETYVSVLQSVEWRSFGVDVELLRRLRERRTHRLWRLMVNHALIHIIKEIVIVIFVRMFNGGKKHRNNDLVVPLGMERNNDQCHLVVVVVVVVCVG